MNQASSANAVRLVVTEDVPRIAEVQVLGWQAAYRGIVADSVLDTLKAADHYALWRSFVGRDGAPLFVVENEVQTVGFCHVMPSRDKASEGVAEIAAIYIDPGHWRKGWGRALIAAALAFARAQNFSSVTLWVLEKNKQGRAFYEDCGFLPDGAKKHEALGGVVITEVRYRRRVDG